MIVGENFRQEMDEFHEQLRALPNTLSEGSEEFKQAYWDWWDSNEAIRKKFCQYTADMSHVYFYNTVWVKRNVGKE